MEKIIKNKIMNKIAITEFQEEEKTQGLGIT